MQRELTHSDLVYGKINVCKLKVEGGGGELKNFKPRLLSVGYGEKV